MMEEDLFACLILNEIPGIGAIKSKQIIDYLGRPSELLEMKNFSELPIKFNREIFKKYILDKSLRKKAENEVNFLLKNRVEVKFYGDKNYPSRLAHCMDAPLVLFYKGNANLEEEKIIAIVGTRKSTSYGKYLVEKLISELKLINPVIVSGLAYGIDKHAHHFALENNLKTIGVLAHGLDIIYPKDHLPMARKMVENGGLITEFMRGEKPERENFPKRNRIIAGLCDAVVVIEAQEKGGALITADIAMSYHREVFTFPGNINSSFSVGCNELIKYQKAQLIFGGKDLSFFMNWKNEINENKQMNFNFKLTELQSIIFDQINREGTSMENLMNLTNVDISRLSLGLLDLELLGLIEKLPGKKFVRIV